MTRHMFLDTCLEQVAKNDKYQISKNMTLGIGELRQKVVKNSAKARIAPNFFSFVSARSHIDSFRFLPLPARLGI